MARGTDAVRSPRRRELGRAVSDLPRQLPDGSFEYEYIPAGHLSGSPVCENPRFESALARLKAFVASHRIQETDGDTGDLLCWELIASSFARPEERAAENVRLKRIREYLEKNLSKDIHLETLASELRMSVSSLRRCWYGGAGNTTFREYRDEIFLQKSCRLLVESRDSVKEIASALGFDDIYYFSRKFHHLSGMTASAYRRKYCIPPLLFPGAAPERR